MAVVENDLIIESPSLFSSGGLAWPASKKCWLEKTCLSRCAEGACAVDGKGKRGLESGSGLRLGAVAGWRYTLPG